MKLTKRFGSLVLAGCLALSALPALAVDADVDTTGDAGAVVGEETALQSEDALKAEAQAAKGYYCSKETVYTDDGSVNKDIYYDERGNVLKTMAYTSDGTSYLSYEAAYDTNGNQTMGKGYNSDGRLYREEEYDANGNLVKITQYVEYNGTTQSYVSYEAAYDENDNVTMFKHYDLGTDGENIFGVPMGIAQVSGSPWSEFTYDANGNLLKEVSHNGDYAMNYTKEYSYDSNGNLTQETEYASNGELDCTIKFEYDANGNQVKKTGYSANGQLYWAYTYDANGNITSYTMYDGGVACETLTYTYDADGNVLSYEDRWDLDQEDNADSWNKYEYTYDSQGNRTKRIYADGWGASEESVYTCEYDTSGNLVKRTRTYYNAEGFTSGNGTTSKDGNGTNTDVRIIYEAAYDENGNRTMEKSYDEWGNETLDDWYGYEYAKLSNNPFTDVASGDWYLDSVLWAVNKGITLGTSDTTFSPDDGCTRAQIVTFLWRSAGSPTPTSTSNPFTDVSADDWYYNAVLWAVENGITAGTSATTFSPNDTCIRSQAMTFIWRANGKQAAGDSIPFTDVATGEWYTDAVLWAVANGITKGTSDTTFGPNDTCTRSQIVTFLYRAA